MGHVATWCGVPGHWAHVLCRNRPSLSIGCTLRLKPQSGSRKGTTPPPPRKHCPHSPSLHQPLPIPKYCTPFAMTAALVASLWIPSAGVRIWKRDSTPPTHVLVQMKM